MKFLFFWGHQKHPKGNISSSCFSQWWSCNFEVEGITYQTSEHWMIPEKARLFGNQIKLKEILSSETPGKAK